MKTLLTRLTLVVVAAVVAVLAVHLILIAASLLRANRNLAKLVEGLEAIRDNTAPLDQDLSTINGAAGTLKNRLVTVDEHLRGIIQLVRE
jgi:HAMP domain-containing protein